MKKSPKNRIVVTPDIMVGKPVIKGTRITVEQIVRQLAQGLTIPELLQNYPHIEEADIYACLDYASDLLEAERVYSS